MGWAARAKQSRGNQAPAPSTAACFIKADAIRNQRRLGLEPVARFGHTEYVITEKGELRCRSRQATAARS